MRRSRATALLTPARPYPRGARLLRTWTLERTEPDFSPLDICQRFTGSIGDDGATIEREWLKSDDGQQWTRDFRLTYTRIDPGVR